MPRYRGMIAASLVTNLFIIALPNPETPADLALHLDLSKHEVQGSRLGDRFPVPQGDADLLEPNARLVGEVNRGGGLVVLGTPEA